MHKPIISLLTAWMMMLVLLAASGGCMTTTVWKWAGQTESGFRSGQGIVGNSRSGRALVLLYANDSESSLLLIPLQADGRPSPPFDGGEISPGLARRSARVAEPHVGVDPSQVIAVCNAASSLVHFQSDPTFRPAGQPQQFPIRGSPLGVTAVAYRLSPNGEFAWIQIPRPPCATQPIQPMALPVDLTGVRVAVIPDTISISKDERQSRKTVAALATPFTAVGDAAVGIAAAPVVAVFAGYVVVYLIVTPSSHWVLP